MMAPILALGLLLGSIYRWLVHTGSMQGLLGMGIACSTLMTYSFLESSITKTFGGLVASILVVAVFSVTLAPRYLRWMMVPRSTAAVEEFMPARPTPMR
jgi:hypothetical protein